MADTYHPTLSAHDRDLLLGRKHYAPHDVLGMHPVASPSSEKGSGGSVGFVIRTVQLSARGVDVLTGEQRLPMHNTGDGIFEVRIAEPLEDYELEVTWESGATTRLPDPYRALPTIGEMDLHLIGEGRHERLWNVLGAQVGEHGTSFTVWAPHAAGVAVVGTFNGWNPRQHPMRALGSSGVWEIYIPHVGPGELYKFAITAADGRFLEKADPLAKLCEQAPGTASVTVRPTEYFWEDGAWCTHRATVDWNTTPMSIYEVHLGSWKRGRSYRELAEELVDYVTDKGFTFVEFMGISEHPFEPSWGYQVTGYYAPNSRFGGPDDLRYLVDRLHQAGIGVIMDWVPGHFPKDDWALGLFDGEACYEHPDPRRGEQPDWGTYVFDFGRTEVRNFLVANALYWCNEFHIDGLRVDAVASMLYLDYSRNEGEWIPNVYGGRENLDAVSFLQETNATLQRDVPGTLTIAEESTSWPGVTAPTEEGGLGFSFKWNMGWMHDTLEYIKRDPAYRSYHHNEITFAMVYAYSERYVLPISHDEVVHGKGTLWSRMPAAASWDKAAMVRGFLGFMWSHPGKKLLFQGQEWGQTQEWNEHRGLDWADMEGWEGEYHRGLSSLTSTLNDLYTSLPALGTADHDPEGFRWIAADDDHNNVLSYIRRGGGQTMACVINFSGRTHENYRIGLPEAARWREVLNTDDVRWEGAGRASGDLLPEAQASHGFGQSATLTIPAHTARWFVAE
ncbi:1,4-alpha-glucan branching protein GlgB [Corynebacterium heidelbergense]|nr:1,4-alpha-glucan branching protein GlgB [Corynebacterium heidelbergense]WCZ36891.1 1,4-alpha-glucan branching enzyme GlgB [Corynebacterium heidelbergense]